MEHRIHHHHHHPCRGDRHRDSALLSQRKAAAEARGKIAKNAAQPKIPFGLLGEFLKPSILMLLNPLIPPHSPTPSSLASSVPPPGQHAAGAAVHDRSPEAGGTRRGKAPKKVGGFASALAAGVEGNMLPLGAHTMEHDASDKVCSRYQLVKLIPLLSQEARLRLVLYSYEYIN